MLDVGVDVATGAALVATGLMAGLFSTFTWVVMPALHRTDDPTFVAAMRAINVAVINVWFGLNLVGALVATVAAAALDLTTGRSAAGTWIVAAGACYLVCLAVTGLRNVPLNDQLAEVVDDEGASDAAVARAAFEAPWNRWNRVRAVASSAAFVCLVVASAVA